MLADPDDLSARVHAVRLALLCDPSPLALILADLLLTAASDLFGLDRPNYRRLQALGDLVARCEAAVGLPTLVG
ncbi:hypothetical protein [Frankia sp. AgW1.1]|uniref:hypothetical protein n=1 Tax=Frankia sp. AgW1.1 TaxID=1836971 RepID=UPI0019331F52|nr:hypothetical protein [Frankia sp. AgW1.1]MBL7487098.1 hypothetical protein [Frankia sp. AgW1.1]